MVTPSILWIFLDQLCYNLCEVKQHKSQFSNKFPEVQAEVNVETVEGSQHKSNDLLFAIMTSDNQIATLTNRNYHHRIC